MSMEMPRSRAGLPDPRIPESPSAPSCSAPNSSHLGRRNRSPPNSSPCSDNLTNSRGRVEYGRTDALNFREPDCTFRHTPMIYRLTYTSPAGTGPRVVIVFGVVAIADRAAAYLRLLEPLFRIPFRLPIRRICAWTIYDHFFSHFRPPLNSSSAGRPGCRPPSPSGP